MTSVCVGAVASQVKAGLPTSIYISPVFLGSILPVQLEWLRPFLPYIPDLFLPLDPFCTGEPPGTSTITDATIAAVFAGGDISAAILAGTLIRDAILNWYWYQVCECSSGTQPTAPTPQADPGGLTAVNPPELVHPPTGTACASFTGQAHVDSTGASIVYLIGTGATFSSTQQVLPANATQMTVTETQIGTTSNQDAVSFITRVWNAAGTQIAALAADTVGPVSAGTNPRVRTLSLPAGAFSFSVGIGSQFGSAPWTQQGKADVAVYCGGAGPGQVTTPCCPPDEILNGTLRQIMQMVTLIQRQIVPFGYIAGTAHSGLSGAGSFGISGLLGVKVSVTTLPSQIGREGTSPTEYFDLGFLTFGTADGYPHSYRLEREEQFTLPARASAFTEIAYDLHPGVVITITELLREP